MMYANANLLPADYDGIKGDPLSTPEAPLDRKPAQFVLDADSSASLVPFMGGKAANLYHLTRHGVPVPAWVCLSSQVCSDVFAELQQVVEGQLSGLAYDNPVSVQQASDTIRALIEQTFIP